MGRILSPFLENSAEKRSATGRGATNRMQMCSNFIGNADLSKASIRSPEMQRDLHWNIMCDIIIVSDDLNQAGMGCKETNHHF